jgi:hypothetical protein
MLLGFSARGIAQAKTDSTAGHFTLIGVVRDTVGMPLSGAQVSAEGLSTLTDEKGEFALHGLPTGTVQLTIRRIGYREVSVGLVAKPDTRGVSIAAKMTPNETTLGTVVIEGKKVDLALFQNGFYTRQKDADGYFFPPERLAKTAASMSTMMNEIPSVKVAYSHGAAIPMAVGGHGMNGPIYCRMNVFLDGTYVPWAKSDGLDAVIAEQDVKAIEVYTRPESVPNTIRGVAGAQSVASQVTTGGRGLGAGSVNCGAILIWSKSPAEQSAAK